MSNERSAALSRTERELTAIDIQIAELSQRKLELQLEREKLELERDAYYMSWKDLKITDHAVLRYLERVKGMDMNSIVEEMFAGSSVAEQTAIVGSGLFPVRKGVLARIVNNVVVTIFTDSKN